MEELELRQLNRNDKESFLKAVREFESDTPPWQFAFDYDPTEEFENYIERVNSWPSGAGVTEGFVPNTYLVGAVGGFIVGRLSLRHELNSFLEQYGGHIGYGVIPSQRRKGYASEMLRLSLQLCTETGIHKAMISCDVDNIPSRKIIERNEGIFDRITDLPDLEVQKRIYWIEIKNKLNKAVLPRQEAAPPTS